MQKNTKEEVKNGDLGLGQIQEKVIDKMSESKEKVVEYIKENPLMSMALAAGVGYILARLLHQRRK